MPLRRTMPMAPGTRPDSKHETVYDPERGGHYRPQRAEREQGDRMNPRKGK